MQKLPIFKSLCQDTIWSVRKGCVESFVNVSNAIHQESRSALVSLMEQFLNDVLFHSYFIFCLFSSRWVRNSAYEQLGPFLSTLRSDQVSREFLKYFTNIPNLSSAEADADCTTHCAFNFPGVALALGKGRWEELHETYNALVRKSFKSRKTLACSVHEICSILGTELTEKYLITAIEFFLKDIDDVRSFF
ncbi:protein phosphatase 4 regulatory subunit 1 [Reticulomyxa filosa]|uniref:Protein phosphatase 4 regulatory subunit 1 n=1 Tax=Reticulomyxa filosa TaxID=46433 RepID=X6L9D8_RETFI|nr:protein phosphatase 4 regulatory subunit 1 [Reticulomyxa filosa]|eukprot:ETN97334.1 protein phosphatase 4 regulatory subunit 1 [Reticulomyxa filosa]